MDGDLTGSRAILIGNSIYRDPGIPNIPGASLGVQAMSDLLTGPLCGWPADCIQDLVDVASPSELARRILAATKDVDSSGVLLLYYVGHGQRTIDGQLALTVGDTDIDPRALPHTAILYDAIAKILRGCQAATKLVILDCCHAELGTKANYQFLSADLAEAYPVDGMYFIGASRIHEKAKASLIPGLTYFTRAFIDVVQTGIPGKPSVLRLDQIFVELRSRMLRAELPEPVESGIRGAHQVPFARNAAPPQDHVDFEKELQRLAERLAELERGRDMSAPSGVSGSRGPSSGESDLRPEALPNGEPPAARGDAEPVRRPLPDDADDVVAQRGVAERRKSREYGTMAHNPFTRYGTVASDERFVGRELERASLRRRLYEARSSAALIGLTRMGKSSLANKILKEAPEGTRTGWVNIATVRSGAEALNDILKMCPQETVLHIGISAKDNQKDTPESTIHDLYRSIRDALLRLGRSGGQLVVVLDEFDSIKHFPDAREFLNLLRELLYDPDRIPMAALVVARSPIDRIEVQAADVSTFASVCDSIYLRPMDYEQVMAMAARSRELGSDAPEVAWKYAMGHPFLSEVAFSRMLEVGTTDIGRIIQSDLTSYYKGLEDFLRKEELWEPLRKLASGREVEVDAEQGALVRRYGLIDENGDVWSPDFSAYLR
jgi:hypothetical protein